MKSPPGIYRIRVTVALFAAGVSLAIAGGCARDVYLDDQKVRSVVVRPVSLFGLRLDETASPEQVAYAALRAIREDFNATTAVQREEALDKQFDLCAANEIQARNRRSLTRDEFVHNVVYRWTPTVSHYVGDFGATWESARKRFRRRTMTPIERSPDGAKECEIAFEVDDPSGDPSARVVLLVWLAQDKGLWRVLHFGFDPTTRTVQGTALVRPPPPRRISVQKE